MAESRGNRQDHSRYYRIAGLTINVRSERPFTDDTFHPELELFRVRGAGRDTVTIRHHCPVPTLTGRELGPLFYKRPPWEIYRKGGRWTYVGITPDRDEPFQVAVFNDRHTNASIYSDERVSAEKYHHSLTFFPTDQLLLARLLAERKGCYIHSCGVDLNGNGLVFAGHCDAGKSTMARKLSHKALILCDDRSIVRRGKDGFRIHGNWSHGDFPGVSPESAPLKALMFLEKAEENRLIRLQDRREIIARLMPCLIRPFLTADWWEKTLPVIGAIADKVPCYTLRSDRSGKIVRVLEEMFPRKDKEGKRGTQG
ncbi:MAG: hypothetical protein ACM3OC_05315 [Deltaproteobacteria bacterium]